VSEGSVSALGGASLVCRDVPALLTTPLENSCSLVEPTSTYNVGRRRSGCGIGT
jgi:hypothetical protein